jgi:hypothetical protein
MSFDDDNRDTPFFVRPATIIAIERTDGTPIQTIDLPELKLTRHQCSPGWLALQEAEDNMSHENKSTTGVRTE